mmetsp:Transcript_26503/g.57624  ORF Transcript_26503/g.57624 Transcript_26503/m.57624 type:complete len:211 (+) Transcript_26503:3790-4422(+)
MCTSSINPMCVPLWRSHKLPKLRSHMLLGDIFNRTAKSLSSSPPPPDLKALYTSLMENAFVLEVLLVRVGVERLRVDELRLERPSSRPAALFDGLSSRALFQPPNLKRRPRNIGFGASSFYLQFNFPTTPSNTVTSTPPIAGHKEYRRCAASRSATSPHNPRRGCRTSFERSCPRWNAFRVPCCTRLNQAVCNLWTGTVSIGQPHEQTKP